MKLLFSTVIAVILISPSNSTAQWVDDILTESDWESYFREGYYDYNTYQIFRSMAEDVSITDTLGYMESAMGTSQSELNMGTGFSGRNNTVVRAVRSSRIRLFRKLSNNHETGYLSLGTIGDDYRLDMKIRKEGNGWLADRRYISANIGANKIEIGDYSIDIGCGLGLGRFDYRPISYEYDPDKNEDWFFPDNSYYNGIHLTRNNISVLSSFKKYPGLSKRLIAAYATIPYKNFEFGTTSAATGLISDRGSILLGSGSFFLQNKNKNRRAEVGYSESGIGFCGMMQNRGSKIKLWHYSNSFVNLQSCGYAHPDYVSFIDNNSELAFRQPQQGETGIYLSRKIISKMISASISSEIWKTPEERIVWSEIDLRFQIYYQQLRFDLGGSARRTTSGSSRIFNLGACAGERRLFGVKAYIWFKDNNIENNRSRYWAFADIPLGNMVTLGGRIRNTLAENLDFFIEQETKLKNSLMLRFTYRWDERYRSDLGPIYLTIEKLW